MPRFVKNNDAICMALYMKPGRAANIELAEYRTWPDFPKKGQHGYSCDELAEFVTRNKEKIAARKSLLLLMNPLEKPTAAQLKLIEAAAQGTRPAEAVAPGMELGRADRQEALATMLQRHFHGRIKNDITPVNITRWKQGTDLPDGAPVPPAKVNGSFDGYEWAEWFEKWILPHWKMDPQSQGDLLNLQALKRKNELEAIEHDMFLRRLERGKYVERDVARNTVIAALKTQHGFFRRLMEAGAPRDLAERLNARGVAPEIVAIARVELAEIGRAAVDAVEAEYDKAAKETAEAAGSPE